MPLATTVCDCTTCLIPHACCLSCSASHCRTSTLPLNLPLSSDRSAVLPGIVLLAGTLLWQGPAMAVGTRAGTPIDNTATADYVIAGSSGTAASTVSFRVDEKLDVNMSWQDAANIGIGTPDTERVTSWLLTNTGNGNESFALSVNNALGGDQFDPLYVDIYLDANGNATFEAGFDTLYAPGVNDPLLAPDSSQLVFVRNSAPAGLNAGDLGNTELIGTTNAGSGLPGMSFPNAGDNGTTAVIGSSGGRGADIGTYEVNATTVTLSKSVVVTDPSGGNQPMTGATLTYRVNASVSGSGTATGIVVTDVLPANTTYSSGTLSLNATALTDVADADAGDVGDTSVNTVTVNLSDLTAVSPIQSISFEVTIN